MGCLADNVSLQRQIKTKLCEQKSRLTVKHNAFNEAYASYNMPASESICSYTKSCLLLGPMCFCIQFMSDAKLCFIWAVLDTICCLACVRH